MDFLPGICLAIRIHATTVRLQLHFCWERALVETAFVLAPKATIGVQQGVERTQGEVWEESRRPIGAGEVEEIRRTSLAPASHVGAEGERRNCGTSTRKCESDTFWGWLGKEVRGILGATSWWYRQNLDWNHSQGQTNRQTHLFTPYTSLIFFSWFVFPFFYLFLF